MRLLFPAAALLVSSCAVAPQRPVAGPQLPPPGQPQARGGLLGLTAGDLVRRFGQPALQIREGTGLKLQFRSRACVLDAYLYPPLQGPGPDRVSHVDTRNASGADVDQASCIAVLQGA